MSNFRIKDLEVGIQDLNNSELEKLQGGSTVGFAFGADNFTIGGGGGGIQGPNGGTGDEEVQASFAAPGFAAFFSSEN